MSDFSSEGDSLEDQERVMVTPDKGSIFGATGAGKTNPEEGAAINTAVKIRGLGDSSSDADNFNLKTQASKATAKSTPVIEKAEESDESMIESCSSSSQSLT